MKTNIVCCAKRNCSFNDSFGRCMQKVIALDDKGICIYNTKEYEKKDMLPFREDFDSTSCR